MYYKNKTKAYEKWSAIYGSYTRVIDEDVNDRYYYRSNFANEKYGIWFCGNNVWFIGTASYNGKCVGAATSEFNTNKCVHDIGFDWNYSKIGLGLVDAGEGLDVKCLYEYGNL